MVSIININIDFKEPTRAYKYKCKLMFGGFVKMREYLYTQIIIWIILILGQLCLYMKVHA